MSRKTLARAGWAERKPPAGFVRGMVIGMIIGFTASMAGRFGDRFLIPTWAIALVVLGVGIAVGTALARCIPSARVRDDEQSKESRQS